MILLFSDVFEDLEPLKKSFHHLHSRGHELVLFHTLAPEELSFAFDGWSRFECLESKHGRVDLEPALIRQEYLERVRTFVTQLKRICGETACDYVALPTNKPIGEVLSQYLKKREARLKAY